MERRIIHPEYPYTADEHVAAWVLLGHSARDALTDLEYLRVELAAHERPKDEESGWFTIGSRVQLIGDFRPAIHLAADILSEGAFLSDQAREGWLSEWTTRLSDSEATARLRELDELGETVTRHKSIFRRLLTDGTI